MTSRVGDRLAALEARLPIPPAAKVALDFDALDARLEAIGVQPLPKAEQAEIRAMVRATFERNRR